MKAKEYCAGDPRDRSACAIIHTATLRVTHLVVRAKGALRTERLVPAEMIFDTSLSSIRLHCTEVELVRMEPFIETRMVEVDPYDHAPPLSVVWNANIYRIHAGCSCSEDVFPREGWL